MKSKSRRNAAAQTRRSSRSKARFLGNRQTPEPEEASKSSGDIISCHELRSTGNIHLNAARANASDAQALSASSTVKCGICLDLVPADSMLQAVLHAVDIGAGSSAGQKKCRHKFCIDCMQQYVTTQVQVKVLAGFDDCSEVLSIALEKLR